MNRRESLSSMSAGVEEGERWSVHLFLKHLISSHAWGGNVLFNAFQALVSHPRAGSISRVSTLMP